MSSSGNQQEDAGDVGAQLHDWYESLSPIKVDIVGDFAGKELFIIHGDSLLLYCITEANVDFIDGFQLLHAIHAIELFLYKLQERGCNFHVVFFEEHEELCLPAGVSEACATKYLLTRAVLIQHLQHRHTGGDAASEGARQVCFEFENHHCAEFEEYMHHNAVHFFMSLDHMFRACSKESGVQYLSILHSFGTRGYSLAFINDAEFVSSKVHTSVVSPSATWSKLPPLPPIESSRTSHVPSSKIDDISKQIASGAGSPWEDGKALTARETISFLAICELLQTTKIEGASKLAVNFLVHLALLRRLSLPQRSLSVVELKDEKNVESFLSKFSDISASLLDDLPSSLKWDMFDLVDGRLLRYICGQTVQLPKGVVTEVHQLAGKISQASGVDLTDSLPPLDAPEKLPHSSANGKATAAASAGVLSFSHPVLNEYMHDLKVVPKSAEMESTPKIFKELTHWHNSRKPLDDVKRVPQPKTFKELRRSQRLMADTIAYSASLTNASGKTIDPETIVVVDQPQATASGKQVASKPNPTKQHAHRGKKPVIKGGKEVKGGKAAALDTARALKQEKTDAKANSALAFWDQQCKEFQKEHDPIKRYKKTIKHLNGLVGELNATVGPEVTLYACNILAGMLSESSQRAAGSRPDKNLSALIWAGVQDISKYSLSLESFKLFEAFAKLLTYPVDQSKLLGTSRALPYTNVFKLLKRGQDLNLTPGTIDFQLEHCGPFLERSFDSAPDPRVPFRPDAWQRKVLDAIDADKSLFVVAPTSSGKTFISFYAMKKVLQATNDGVLVYVAPTKALVNQIAAEIQARYSKTYHHEGRSVWGIHTRDHRVNNPTGCQVLVTVPDILQIMLLAPSNAENPNSWSRRVKRIIFDEVHCIGQAEDGVVWEQLLLLAPCPIIALSATVGNPVEFKSWLESTEKAKGYELETIVHSARYSDLRKFLYQAPDEFKFTGLHPNERVPVPGLDDGSAVSARFAYINPVASLINRHRETLDDISFEPRDCLLLWKSMHKHQTKEFPLPESLNPEKGLPRVIKKADVTKYEALLKKTLHAWMLDSKSPFPTVKNEFDIPSAKAIKAVDENDGLGIVLKNGARYGNIHSQALPLLMDLHMQGALPAIIFNYDRVYCEELVFAILTEVEEAENAWKETNTGYQKKLAKYNEWKKDEVKMKALREKAAKAKASKSQRDGDEEGADDGRDDDEPTSFNGFDPNAPLPLFSFADETKYSMTELDNTIRSMRYANLKPEIISALRRGIAVHHAGMNRAYRQAVEILFRKGFLTVVVATGTLALGLNMPCKSVVFFGDSVFLTALNYHQAAGRSGRRGFDLLGNVVFAGMPKERVFEIMSSRLPDLRGNFSLSTTLVLRTLGLLHHTKNSEFSVRAVKSLLSQTRLYLGGPADQMSIKHHLRFSIEYLRRQHLLSDTGAPLNFSGLVGHLYFTENAVFAFHSLLKEGYFHEICADIARTPDAVLLKLTLVLSHIFCRIPVRDYGAGWRKKIVHGSPSMVFLPPLPEDALVNLRKHNQETLHIFKTYVGTYVDQHLAGVPDTQMPFTNYEAGSKAASEELDGLLESQPPTKLRSPFAAMSGFNDEFKSIHDLCSTVRGGVFLEESAIPYMPIYPDDTDGIAWNAYIYDFFKHGDLEALIKDNRIKRGDVWFYLKDFSLILATIVTSITNFLDSEGKMDDADMIDIQDAEDRFKEDVAVAQAGPKEDDAAAQAAAAAETVAAVPAAGPVAKKKKKAKVADSWDDSDDESDGDTTVVGSEAPTDWADASSTTGTAFTAPPAWDGEGEKSLVQVLDAFKLLREQFDEKFKKIWA